MAQQLLPARPAPLFLLGSLLLLLPPSALLGEVMMPGGLFPVSVTSKEVRAAAEFAVEQYNRQSNSAYIFKPLRILKAQSQVVAGVKYYLLVELVNTCEKRSGKFLNHEDLQNCAAPPEDQQQRLICNFVIWSRPWLNEMTLSSMNCEAEKS